MSSHRKEWGDQHEDEGIEEVKESLALPPRSETKPDKDGVKTVTEWHLNEKGQKVKVIRKVKVSRRTQKVHQGVLKRRQWKKFGDCAGLPPGPEENITYVAWQENIQLNCALEKKQETKLPEAGALPAGRHLFTCRNCGESGHFTLQCPNRAGPGLKKATEAAGSTSSSMDVRESGSGATEGKYVAPGRRAGAGRGETMGGSHDDSASLRVTNLSEDTTEEDLKELFRPFGRTSRVFLAKDRGTNTSRGFAFISFERKEDAAKALEALHGHGYDNLILHVEWAKPREDKP